jgi:hypothetical protein
VRIAQTVSIAVLVCVETLLTEIIPMKKLDQELKHFSVLRGLIETGTSLCTSL